MSTAAIYGSHDATLCVLNDEGRVWNFEFERWFGERYFRFPQNVKPGPIEAIDTAMTIAGVEQPAICYWQRMYKCWLDALRKMWPGCEFIWQPHHPAHAAGAFVQSGLDEAIVISYDGGGSDARPEDDNISFFKIFHAKWSKDGFVPGVQRGCRDSLLFATDTKGKVLVHRGRDVGGLSLDLIKEYPWNLGIGYGLLGWALESIKKHGGEHRKEFLKFAGKIMGLSAYGYVNTATSSGDSYDLMFAMRDFLEKPHEFTVPSEELAGIVEDFRQRLGLTDASLAWGMQDGFYDALNQATLWHDRSKQPWIFTGGCALNVLANTERHVDFVPPNPGDHGIPFGMLCLNGHITEPIPYLHYSGWPILDDPPEGGRPLDVDELASMLAAGKVIGVMRGQSEHGPRALGNRSILCDPRAGMKNHLNAKIKFREDFRPYAPVIRREIAEKYFEDCPDSPFMSYSPRAVTKAKFDALTDEEHIHPLDQSECIGPDVIHVDGTSRVQTVTREQNPWLYDLLLAFEQKSGRVCLLNTSFNIKGKPILATCAEAMQVLKETALDAVLIEERLYE